MKISCIYLAIIASLAQLSTGFDVGKSAGNNKAQLSRRNLLQFIGSVPLAASLVLPANAVTPTGPNDGNLPDLPPEAVRSYLQYRYPLQTSADFYVFELQRLLDDTNEWGVVGEFFQVNNNRGQGNPSRIEREFSNVMRVLGLSMPPDEAEGLQTAQFKFDKAMAMISKSTGGIRRDLPVEIDNSQITMAKTGWNEGRMALNEFFTILNDTTGLKEMRTIPEVGPNQFAKYGRSERKYIDLKKKIKLCQNRGGPTLSQAWGQLVRTTV